MDCLLKLYNFSLLYLLVREILYIYSLCFQFSDTQVHSLKRELERLAHFLSILALKFFLGIKSFFSLILSKRVYFHRYILNINALYVLL